MTPIQDGPKGMTATVPEERTRAQKLALSHPCKAPEDRANERYREGGIRLTYDTFGHPPEICVPCWHAMTAVETLSNNTHALSQLHEALEGVGTGRTVVCSDEGIMRARRAASMAEQAASVRATEARNGQRR